MILYVLTLVLVYALHLLLKLNLVISLILLAFAEGMTFLHVRLYRKAEREKKRLGEASVYMDTLLYAFLKEEKILLAFEDLEQTLADGRMRTIVEQALDHMKLTFDDSEVYRDAMTIIEKEYPCKRIENIHNFMYHVEQYGGEITRSVNVLLEDKSRWVNRIERNRKEREKGFREVVMSAAASILICGMILYLPVMNIDISSNLVTQIVALAVIVLDDLIVLRAQTYTACDWLQLDLATEEIDYDNKMEKWRSYKPGEDRRLSLILGSVMGAVTLALFLFVNRFAGLAGLILTAFCFLQDRIGRWLMKRNLTRNIQSEFPNWLMDLVLLLQSENVQVALRKSKETVPDVLRSELDLLTDRIDMDPEGSGPYHEFLKDFAIPEVNSAMNMLYSLSVGTSSNADKQMNELIERNLEMMDLSERERLSNRSSLLYLLFLAPVLTASVKLVVDMLLFMTSFLTNGII